MENDYENVAHDHVNSEDHVNHSYSSNKGDKNVNDDYYNDERPSCRLGNSHNDANSDKDVKMDKYNCNQNGDPDGSAGYSTNQRDL